MVAFMLGSPAGAAPDPADDGAADESDTDEALDDDPAPDPTEDEAGEDDDAPDGEAALGEAGVELDPHAVRTRPPTNATAASWMDFFTSTSMLSIPSTCVVLGRTAVDLDKCRICSQGG
jgi:hypothetical protein